MPCDEIIQQALSFPWYFSYPLLPERSILSSAATKPSIVNDEVVLQESQWMEGRTKYKGCSQVSHLDLKHLGEEL